MGNAEIINEINKLKKERDAVIVSHSYQIGDIQDIADIVGDSFALSKYCATRDSKVIVFCGVHFMAESAKILSPDKTVLLPEIHAGCPMADMAAPEKLKIEKEKYPNATVICYINSSAAVKALCDVCCTSSNAVKILKSVESEEVLFLPDKNLATYCAKQVPEKKVILWEGFCPPHDKVTAATVLKVKKEHPDALFLIHPECRSEVIEFADFIGSTSAIIEFAGKSDAKKFIIGTEMGVLHALNKNNPDKTFYTLSPGLVCPNMKKITLESVYEALRDMKYQIEVPAEIAAQARKCLDKMLEIA